MHESVVLEPFDEVAVETPHAVVVWPVDPIAAADAATDAEPAAARWRGGQGDLGSLAATSSGSPVGGGDLIAQGARRQMYRWLRWEDRRRHEQDRFAAGPSHRMSQALGGATGPESRPPTRWHLHHGCHRAVAESDRLATTFDMEGGRSGQRGQLF